MLLRSALKSSSSCSVPTKTRWLCCTACCSRRMRATVDVLLTYSASICISSCFSADSAGPFISASARACSALARFSNLSTACCDAAACVGLLEPLLSCPRPSLALPRAAICLPKSTKAADARALLVEVSSSSERLFCSSADSCSASCSRLCSRSLSPSGSATWSRRRRSSLRWLAWFPTSVLHHSSKLDLRDCSDRPSDCKKSAGRASFEAAQARKRTATRGRTPHKWYCVRAPGINGRGQRRCRGLAGAQGDGPSHTRANCA
mmetsp:Transcript_66641/g.171544  ORF Transcript_66641/g.171544 Transcript_66641/m.171544 type:complete len:263 (-) Transcript_66641:2-790(-)